MGVCSWRSCGMPSARCAVLTALFALTYTFPLSHWAEQGQKQGSIRTSISYTACVPNATSARTTYLFTWHVITFGTDCNCQSLSVRNQSLCINAWLMVYRPISRATRQAVET
jgi:hypothetical protein